MKEPSRGAHPNKGKGQRAKGKGNLEGKGHKPVICLKTQRLSLNTYFTILNMHSDVI